MDDLPDNVLLDIFGHLSTEDVCLGTRQVCTRWRKLSSRASLWKLAHFTARIPIQLVYAVLKLEEVGPKVFSYHASFQIQGQNAKRK